MPVRPEFPFRIDILDRRRKLGSVDYPCGPDDPRLLALDQMRDIEVLSIDGGRSRWLPKDARLTDVGFLCLASRAATAAPKVELRLGAGWEPHKDWVLSLPELTKCEIEVAGPDNHPRPMAMRTSSGVTSSSARVH